MVSSKQLHFKQVEDVVTPDDNQLVNPPIKKPPRPNGKPRIAFCTNKDVVFNNVEDWSDNKEPKDRHDQSVTNGVTKRSMTSGTTLRTAFQI